MKKIINPFIHLDGYNCFGCAPQNPLGLKLTFYEDGDDIVATWQPRPEFQGWLNTLHGGVQATLYADGSSCASCRPPASPRS